MASDIGTNGPESEHILTVNNIEWTPGDWDPKRIIGNDKAVRPTRVNQSQLSPYTQIEAKSKIILVPDGLGAVA